MSNDAFARLLNGRKAHPWGTSLGLSSGTISRIINGEIPKPEILSIIMKAENVSLSWLAEMKGPPFHTTYRSTDEEMAEAVENYLEENANWDLAILTDDYYVAFVFHMDTNILYKDKSIPYHQIEVEIGQPGEKTRNTIAKFFPQLSKKQTHFVALEVEEMKALRFGQWGTYKLIGDEKMTGIIYKRGHQIDNILNVIPETAHGNELISLSLMNSIMNMIDNIIERDGLTLDKAQYSRAVTSVYRLAQRSKATVNTLDENSILAILEAL